MIDILGVLCNYVVVTIVIIIIIVTEKVKILSPACGSHRKILDRHFEIFGLDAIYLVV